jgi:hypothetical protein
MQTTHSFGVRTQNRSISPSNQPIGTADANRPRIFILSDVRLYREGLAWSLSQLAPRRRVRGRLQRS